MDGAARAAAKNLSDGNRYIHGSRNMERFQNHRRARNPGAHGLSFERDSADFETYLIIIFARGMCGKARKILRKIAQRVPCLPRANKTKFLIIKRELWTQSDKWNRIIS